MMFAGQIKQLGEELQMPQRKLAEALEFGTATTYCKIEKGERKVKSEHIFVIDEHLSFWFVEQVYSVVKDGKHAGKALNIVTKNCRMMPSVEYLMLAIHNDYLGNDDFSKIFQFFETLYINSRLQLPLKRIILIRD
jgi:DNA-binding XRE family transcriptional regulator